jgi:hypothetical protein
MSVNEISRQQAVKILFSIRFCSASLAALFTSSTSARVKLSGFLEQFNEEGSLSFVLTRPPRSSKLYLIVPYANREASFFFGRIDVLPDDMRELADAEGDSLLVIRFDGGDTLGLRFTGKPN